MLATLRQPKWIIAGAVVLLLAAVFVRLGIWQLDRHEERQAENALGQSRIAAPPATLESLLREAGGDLASIQYRRVFADGVFDVDSEVLIRSQVDLGSAGFHVITPLVLNDETAVLVNRGWVPLTMDSTPVDAAPEDGNVTVDGWVQLSASRPPLGAVEPEGEIDVFNRVDVDRIGQQLTHQLVPLYVVETGGRDVIPRPQRLPDFSDDGPHLAYAIQWFGFALTGVAGFLLLARKSQSR